MAELRRDFESAREFHTQLYDFADESQLPTMDKWENDLTNDVYSIEEETELYLSTISLPEASQTSQIQSTSQNMQSMQTLTEPEIEPETIPVSSIENNPANEITEAPQVSPISVESGQNTINTNLSSPTTPRPFDAWIDDLHENLGKKRHATTARRYLINQTATVRWNYLNHCAGDLGKKLLLVKN
ncbi:Hypothetical predicted protein, partial [Paramuricea clavata]